MAVNQITTIPEVCKPLIKPIETRYSGCKFRSRLEARHAVALDNLGIPWEYEKEGYDIDGKWYLPDFWLPQQKWWIEVKGEYPTPEHWDKLSAIAEHTKAEGAYIFWGGIQVPGPYDPAYRHSATPALLVYPYWDDPYFWCECPVCGKLGIEFEGRSDRICDCFPVDRGCNYDSLNLRLAFAAAKSHRF